MKKKSMLTNWIFLISFFIIFTGNAPAEEVPVVFMPEQVFTFDPVWDGDPVTHDFVLINKGTAPLEILKIEND